MVTVEDLRHILERRRYSYYLTPMTFGYFHYLFKTGEIWFFKFDDLWLYLMLISGFAATLMFVEEEIREDVDDYFEVSPWVYFETANLVVWAILTLYVVYSYLTWVNWNQDFWLSALGFVNLTYLIGWVVDKIFAYKYSKYYADDEGTTSPRQHGPQADSNDNQPDDGEESAPQT